MRCCIRLRGAGPAVGTFLVLACAPHYGAGQSIRASPSRVMADEAAAIQVSGLNPHERVEIRAELLDGAKQRWTSAAEFEADEFGSIDTATRAPVRGSYKRASAMGLVWSMMPAGRSRGYEHPTDDGVQITSFDLIRGSGVIGTTQLAQVFRAPGVRQVRLHGALSGSLYLPEGPGPWPGVLVLGGSEGGVPAAKALWLASHGYAALALAYFQHENLPDHLEGIALEYFGRALAWLQQRPDILGQELAVVGTSRGGELALQLGSMYPQVNAVVAFAPASVRYPSCCSPWLTAAWTFAGEGLEYLRPAPPSVSRRRRSDETAEIAVERTRGPVMVISGGEDEVWPSTLMTQAVVARLRDSDFPYAFERLEYPHAGHSVGSPEIVPAWTGSLVQPPSGDPVTPGGSVEANAESGLDAGPKVLEFLDEALRPGKGGVMAALR